MLLILYNPCPCLRLLYLGYLWLSSGLHYWTGLCGKGICTVELLSFHIYEAFYVSFTSEQWHYWCRIELKHILSHSDSLHICPGFCFVVFNLSLLKYFISLGLMWRSLLKILGLQSNSHAWLVAIGWIPRTHIWPKTSLPSHMSYQLWIIALKIKTKILNNDLIPTANINPNINISAPVASARGEIYYF